MERSPPPPPRAVVVTVSVTEPPDRLLEPEPSPQAVFVGGGGSGTSPTASSSDVRLPSYLSLACTVNGYSSTTNYDPDRLARSRDASPHRHHDLAATTTTAPNLLSPPNLVPLPFGAMAAARPPSSSSAARPRGDAPPDDGKSFIQQRVERLYGPGALAQGFFVTKKQRRAGGGVNGACCRAKAAPGEGGDDVVGDGDDDDRGSKQTPSLPVLRHLRPEFRAQLPITVTSKKSPVAKGSAQRTSLDGDLPTANGASNGHVAMNCSLNGNSTTVVVVAAADEVDAQKTKRKPISNQQYAVKDGHYFISVLEKEASRILALAAKAEEELESQDLGEDAKGFLRSASGKARLLVTQKMQQFEGLCRNNLTQVEGDAFPTTDEDLQGFWDMIMLQVRQIDNLFAEIDRLKSNNWQEEAPPPAVPRSNGGMVNGKGSIVGRKVVKVAPRPTSAAAEENRRLREAQRKKMLEDRRRAMREQHQKGPRQQGIEIYVPETN